MPMFGREPVAQRNDRRHRLHRRLHRVQLGVGRRHVVIREHSALDVGQFGIIEKVLAGYGFSAYPMARFLLLNQQTGVVELMLSVSFSIDELNVGLVGLLTEADL